MNLESGNDKSDIKQLLSGFPVVVEQNVAWGEMDAYQHVNNVVYFRYFENARLEYFQRIGWEEIEQSTGVGPIVHSISARFRKPLTYPDRISIGARLGSMSTDRLTLVHTIVSHKLQAVTTEGECIVVTFHYGENRKAPMPDIMRRRIEELEASVKQL